MIQIFATSVAQTLALRLAQQLGVHIQHKHRANNIVQIGGIRLQGKYPFIFILFVGQFLHQDHIDGDFYVPGKVGGATIADTVNTAIRPIAIGIITALATVILFLLLIIILRKLITKPIVLLFRFPILNFVNRLLGAVIGFIDAFLLVSMLAYLTKLIIVNASPQSSWFNESTIYNSFIFYHFYSGNIFSWISSLITGIKI